MNKTFVVQLLIKIVKSCAYNNHLKILEKMLIFHVFHKKIGNLINSLKENNSHENYNVKNVTIFEVYTNKLHNRKENL